MGDGAGELICPRIRRVPPACWAGPGEECPTWSETKEESSDPLVRPGNSPYQDILDGVKSFVTTYPENKDWATCPFIPPSRPRKINWADECIKNARKVGFLDEIKGRPNEECPAGWFLCKGMCYVRAFCQALPAARATSRAAASYCRLDLCFPTETPEPC